MTTMSEISCFVCGKIVKRSLGEIKRSQKLGRQSFCSISCAAKANNAPRRSKEFVTGCPYCGVEFVTSTHNKAKRFCSRSCASKGSMSEERREAQRQSGKIHCNNFSTAKGLRSREAWKYVALQKYLGKRHYQFEFEINGCIFDLALLDKNILVEFDGPYHAREPQLSRDADKDHVANKAGFKVVRRNVESMTVISPSTIEGL